VASWRVPRSYEFFGLAGMGAGSGVSKSQLDGLITSALSQMDATLRQGLWTQILTAVNADALFAPLTYMTTRAVVRPEVSGFTFGQQQVSARGCVGGGRKTPSKKIPCVGAHSTHHTLTLRPLTLPPTPTTTPPLTFFVV
jgi:hypothetical protein